MKKFDSQMIINSILILLLLKIYSCCYVQKKILSQHIFFNISQIYDTFLKDISPIYSVMGLNYNN